MNRMQTAKKQALPRRIFAAFFCLCYVLVNHAPVPAFAQQTSLMVPDGAREIFEDVTAIRIPKQIGEVQEFYRGSEDKIVVLIQDAHSIPDAQNSIRAMIKFFQQTYGFDLTLLEGASTELDSRIFQSFPDRETLKQAFQGYLGKGELTGGTAASVFNPGLNHYHGIEDWEMYEDQIDAFLDAISSESPALDDLAAANKELGERKRREYSAALLTVDQAIADFENNRMHLAELLKTLAAVEAPEKGSRLEAILALTAEGSSEEIAFEVKRLAQKVKTALHSVTPEPETLEDLREFNQAYQEFSLSTMTPEAFALILRKLVSKYRIPVQVSSRLNARVGKQKTMRDIRGTQLFKELEAYEAAVKGSLFKNSYQQALDREGRNISLLERLASLELDQDDWQQIQNTAAKMDAWVVRTDGVLTQNLLQNLFDKLRHHFEFYRIAHERDLVFFRRTLELMKKYGRSKSILISGGFHTEGLTRQFRERGISYVLASPAIESLPDQPHYREHMRGEVSWSTYFQVKDGRVNLYDAFVRGTRDYLLTLSNEKRGVLLKKWRDQIIRDLANEGSIENASKYLRFIDEVQEKNGKAQTIRELWMKQIDRFVEGMRRLDNEGQLTEANVMGLMRPASLAAEFALAGALSGNEIRSSALRFVTASEAVVRDTAARQPAQEKRSEQRSQEKTAAVEKALEPLIAEANRLLAEDASAPEITGVRVTETVDSPLLDNGSFLQVTGFSPEGLIEVRVSNLAFEHSAALENLIREFLFGFDVFQVETDLRHVMHIADVQLRPLLAENGGNLDASQIEQIAQLAFAVLEAQSVDSPGLKSLLTEDVKAQFVRDATRPYATRAFVDEVVAAFTANTARHHELDLWVDLATVLRKERGWLSPQNIEAILNVFADLDFAAEAAREAEGQVSADQKMLQKLGLLSSKKGLSGLTAQPEVLYDITELFKRVITESTDPNDLVTGLSAFAAGHLESAAATAVITPVRDSPGFASLASQAPGIVNLLNNQGKAAALFNVLSTARSIFHYEQTAENDFEINLGNNLFARVDTSSFRRHILIEKNNTGQVVAAVEIKIPGDLKHKAIVSTNDYDVGVSLSKHQGLENRFQRALAVFHYPDGDYSLYGMRRSFRQPATSAEAVEKEPVTPLFAVISEYDMSHHSSRIRLGEKFFSQHDLSLEQAKSVARQVEELLLLVTESGYVGGMDFVHLENFHAELIDGQVRISLVNDFRGFSRAESAEEIKENAERSYYGFLKSLDSIFEKRSYAISKNDIFNPERRGEAVARAIKNLESGRSEQRSADEPVSGASDAAQSTRQNQLRQINEIRRNLIESIPADYPITGEETPIAEIAQYAQYIAGVNRGSEGQVLVEIRPGVRLGLIEFNKIAAGEFFRYTQALLSRGTQNRKEAFKNTIGSLVMLAFQLYPPFQLYSREGETLVSREGSLGATTYLTGILTVPLLTLLSGGTALFIPALIVMAVIQVANFAVNRWVPSVADTSGHEMSHTLQTVIFERVREAVFPEMNALDFQRLIPDEARQAPVHAAPILKRRPPSAERLQMIIERAFDDIERYILPAAAQQERDGLWSQMGQAVTTGASGGNVQLAQDIQKQDKLRDTSTVDPENTERSEQRSAEENTDLPEAVRQLHSEVQGEAGRYAVKSRSFLERALGYFSGSRSSGVPADFPVVSVVNDGLALFAGDGTTDVLVVQNPALAEVLRAEGIDFLVGGRLSDHSFIKTLSDPLASPQDLRLQIEQAAVTGLNRNLPDDGLVQEVRTLLRSDADGSYNREKEFERRVDAYVQELFGADYAAKHEAFIHDFFRPVIERLFAKILLSQGTKDLLNRKNGVFNILLNGYNPSRIAENFQENGWNGNALIIQLFDGWNSLTDAVLARNGRSAEDASALLNLRFIMHAAENAPAVPLYLHSRLVAYWQRLIDNYGFDPASETSDLVFSYGLNAVSFYGLPRYGNYNFDKSLSEADKYKTYLNLFYEAIDGYLEDDVFFNQLLELLTTRKIEVNGAERTVTGIVQLTEGLVGKNSIFQVNLDGGGRVLVKTNELQKIQHDQIQTQTAAILGLKTYHTGPNGYAEEEGRGKYNSWQIIEYVPHDTLINYSVFTTTGDETFDDAGVQKALSGTQAEIESRFAELGGIFATEYILDIRDAKMKHILLAREDGRFFKIDSEFMLGRLFQEKDVIYVLEKYEADFLQQLWKYLAGQGRTELAGRIQAAIRRGFEDAIRRAAEPETSDRILTVIRDTLEIPAKELNSVLENTAQRLRSGKGLDAVRTRLEDALRSEQRSAELQQPEIRIINKQDHAEEYEELLKTLPETFTFENFLSDTRNEIYFVEVSRGSEKKTFKIYWYFGFDDSVHQRLPQSYKPYVSALNKVIARSIADVTGFYDWQNLPRSVVIENSVGFGLEQGNYLGVRVSGPATVNPMIEALNNEDSRRFIEQETSFKASLAHEYVHNHREDGVSFGANKNVEVITQLIQFLFAPADNPDFRFLLDSMIEQYQAFYQGMTLDGKKTGGFHYAEATISLIALLGDILLNSDKIIDSPSLLKARENISRAFSEAPFVPRLKAVLNAAAELDAESLKQVTDVVKADYLMLKNDVLQAAVDAATERLNAHAGRDLFAVERLLDSGTIQVGLLNLENPLGEITPGTYTVWYDNVNAFLVHEGRLVKIEDSSIAAGVIPAGSQVTLKSDGVSRRGAVIPAGLYELLFQEGQMTLRPAGTKEMPYSIDFTKTSLERSEQRIYQPDDFAQSLQAALAAASGEESPQVVTGIENRSAFEQALPKLAAILFDEAKAKALFEGLSQVRSQVPFQRNEINNFEIALGDGVFVRVDTGSFRRHILLERDAAGDLRGAVDIKIPGDRVDRTTDKRLVDLNDVNLSRLLAALPGLEGRIQQGLLGLEYSPGTYQMYGKDVTFGAELPFRVIVSEYDISRHDSTMRLFDYMNNRGAQMTQAQADSIAGQVAAIYQAIISNGWVGGTNLYHLQNFVIDDDDEDLPVLSLVNDFSGIRPISAPGDERLISEIGLSLTAYLTSGLKKLGLNFNAAFDAMTNAESEARAALRSRGVIRSEQRFDDSAFQEVVADFVSALYEVGEPVSYRPGEKIITQGTQGKELYLVIAGAATVTQTAENGLPLERVLNSEEELVFLGEMAYFKPDKMRQATVYAKTPVRALKISYDTLEQIDPDGGLLAYFASLAQYREEQNQTFEGVEISSLSQSVSLELENGFQALMAYLAENEKPAAEFIELSRRWEDKVKGYMNLVTKQQELVRFFETPEPGALAKARNPLKAAELGRLNAQIAQAQQDLAETRAVLTEKLETSQYLPANLALDLDSVLYYLGEVHEGSRLELPFQAVYREKDGTQQTAELYALYQKTAPGTVKIVVRSLDPDARVLIDLDYHYSLGRLDFTSTRTKTTGRLEGKGLYGQLLDGVFRTNNVQYVTTSVENQETQPLIITFYENQRAVSNADLPVPQSLLEAFTLLGATRKDTGLVQHTAYRGSKINPDLTAVRILNPNLPADEQPAQWRELANVLAFARDLEVYNKTVSAQKVDQVRKAAAVLAGRLNKILSGFKAQGDLFTAPNQVPGIKAETFILEAVESQLKRLLELNADPDGALELYFPKFSRMSVPEKAEADFHFRSELRSDYATVDARPVFVSPELLEGLSGAYATFVQGETLSQAGAATEGFVSDTLLPLQITLEVDGVPEEFTIFNASGSQGVIYKNDRTEKIAKIFILPSVRIPPASLRFYQQINNALSDQGLPVTRIDSVSQVAEGALKGHAAIIRDFRPGVSLGDYVLEGRREVYPDSISAGTAIRLEVDLPGNETKKELVQTAEKTLNAIDTYTKDNFGFALTDRRTNAKGDPDDLENFLIAEDGTLENIDPLNASSLLLAFYTHALSQAQNLDITVEDFPGSGEAAIVRFRYEDADFKFVILEEGRVDFTYEKNGDYGSFVIDYSGAQMSPIMQLALGQYFKNVVILARRAAAGSREGISLSDRESEAVKKSIVDAVLLRRSEMRVAENAPWRPVFVNAAIHPARRALGARELVPADLPVVKVTEEGFAFAENDSLVYQNPDLAKRLLSEGVQYLAGDLLINKTALDKISEHISRNTQENVTRILKRHLVFAVNFPQREPGTAISPEVKAVLEPFFRDTENNDMSEKYPNIYADFAGVVEDIAAKALLYYQARNAAEPEAQVKRFLRDLASWNAGNLLRRDHKGVRSVRTYKALTVLARWNDMLTDILEFSGGDARVLGALLSDNSGFFSDLHYYGIETVFYGIEQAAEHFKALDRPDIVPLYFTMIRPFLYKSMVFSPYSYTESWQRSIKGNFEVIDFNFENHLVLKGMEHFSRLKEIDFNGRSYRVGKIAPLDQTIESAEATGKSPIFKLELLEPSGTHAGYVLVKYVPARDALNDQIATHAAARLGLVSYHTEIYGETPEHHQQPVWQLIELKPSSYIAFEMRHRGLEVFEGFKRLAEGSAEETADKFRAIGRIFALEFVLGARDAKMKHILYAAKEQRPFRIDWAENLLQYDARESSEVPSVLRGDERDFISRVLELPEGALYFQHIVEGFNELLDSARADLGSGDASDLLQIMRARIPDSVFTNVEPAVKVRVALSNEDARAQLKLGLKNDGTFLSLRSEQRTGESLKISDLADLLTLRTDRNGNRKIVNVLVAEDQKDRLERYRQTLRDLGIVVHAFNNGIDAYKSFLVAYRQDGKSPLAFDLVITDRHMPVAGQTNSMTGDILVDIIRQAEVTRGETPVIIVSAEHPGRRSSPDLHKEPEAPTDLIMSEEDAAAFQSLDPAGRSLRDRNGNAVENTAYIQKMGDPLEAVYEDSFGILEALVAELMKRQQRSEQRLEVVYSPDQILGIAQNLIPDDALEQIKNEVRLVSRVAPETAARLSIDIFKADGSENVKQKLIESVLTAFLVSRKGPDFAWTESALAAVGSEVQALIASARSLKDRNYTVGLSVPADAEGQADIPLLSNLLRITEEGSNLSEITLSGKLAPQVQGRFEKSNVFVRSVNLRRSQILLNDQPAVPLLVISQLIEKIDEMFVPLKANFEDVSDPLMIDYAELLRSVAALHMADLLAQDASLLKDADRLKAQLLTRLQMFGSAFENILTQDGDGWVIQGAAARAYLEMRIAEAAAASA